ncbi:MAG TPA: replication-associated recombination protein RarA [Nitrospina sp.]|nr:replication-associated recombination protein RarA [Nitrospinota bacterium]MDP6335078.1 replication-associated recombination protein A [Nitrospinaceae bacterium]MDP7148098.1 replication-associated recombination protein A [Nitrospinaceae bacterium]HAX46058.1 replication-associated recombination protein RarA [Nitrospina sp.]
MELFPEFEESSSDVPPAPLAERMRPSEWKDLLGHVKLVGEGKPLRELIAGPSSFSFILWGPPGSGKTTIARIAARMTGSEFHEISAVNAGVADIRKVISQAQKVWRFSKRRSILFIDEIHRFNKSQQDAVLPHVESGTLRLIGSTTENPSFEVIPALRSRCQIFRLESLTQEDIRSLLERGLADREHGFGKDSLVIESDAIDLIITCANGDARKALNVLEAARDFSCSGEGDPRPVQIKDIEGIIQTVAVLYDKGGTEHYDHASAFQKSLRGSDPDAAIYWLAKMIAGGEAPRFIARRLVVTASEDVGNADPMALVIANAAAEASERLGWPDARIPLAQAVIYVARARKDNSAIVAVDSALGDIQNKGKSFPVPDHLKDTHYSDAKTQYGYGKDYLYPHDHPGHKVKQDYLPTALKGREYVPPEETDKSEDEG